MEKKDSAPFHESEYEMVRKLSTSEDPNNFLKDISSGNCKRMYAELQQFYRNVEDDILFVIPTINNSGLFGMYTRNLYDAYKHDYLPGKMIGDLIPVVVKLKDGYQGFPKVLTPYALSSMDPELREVVEKYICTIHAGQVILSSEICEIRGTSWEESFEEPYRDILLALNI